MPPAVTLTPRSVHPAPGHSTASAMSRGLLGGWRGVDIAAAAGVKAEAASVVQDPRQDWQKKGKVGLR